jgi:hypothetical protein
LLAASDANGYWRNAHQGLPLYVNSTTTAYKAVDWAGGKPLPETLCGGLNRRGSLGVAYTRGATHVGPTDYNAHPHVSRDTVAVVHNGIIENHEALRARLKRLGYEFTSDTDTEVVAHLVHYYSMFKFLEFWREGQS